MTLHGGDIYRNRIKTDFSININPLGTPESVVKALHNAVDRCGAYPDGEAEKLKQAVAGQLGIPASYLLFGNGASELLMAAAHAVRAKKTVIPTPSFYGYEYAAQAAGGEIVYYEMRQQDAFSLTKKVYDVLSADTDLLFLANPNNPTGVLLDKAALMALLRHCRDKDICVMLDECFIEFCGEGFSMLSTIDEFPNLILIRAFTKIFSIPGVRLGYLVCSDAALLLKIAGQLPEWNLSCFAQAAGCACANEIEFIRETEQYVRKERQFLEAGLRQNGLRVFPSAANFLLIYSEKPLYQDLLEKGILIRDCSNFRGLGQGYYRIAVKSREENEKLLEVISKMNGNQAYATDRVNE